MLKIPEKYSRLGIKIKCLKCKWQVSESCGLTKKKISTCQYKSKHRYNLMVCVPGGGGRRSKIIDAKNFAAAMAEQIKFREELKVAGYHKRVLTPAVTNTTVAELAAEFLDSMSGINTHAFKKRTRSSDHVNDCRRVLERFMRSLKERGYNILVLDVKDIHDNEVQIIHDYLLEKLKLAQGSYNKHFVILKSFFNWIIRFKDISVRNPFSHASLEYTKKEKNIITKNEFEALLKVITPENGFNTDKTKTRSYYKDWLKVSFRLALETGLRREELFELKWSDLVQIESNGLVFRIGNFKVNRITSGHSEGRYIKHVPVTKSLKKLLVELGFARKKKTGGYIIERPAGMDIKFLMDTMSRGFAHYIKQVTKRRIEFKDLRKTYITHLAMALGDKTKLFTGHTQDEILQAHYISSAFAASKLSKFSVF